MNASGHRYFIINKPYNMVSQFVSVDDVRLLGALDFDFPEGTHAIGRLDNNSEGLLILTTNKKVTKLLFQGKEPHRRVYLCRVRGLVTPEDLHILRTGVPIRIKENELYVTPPSEVHLVDEPENMFHHPEETKEYSPYCWLTIALYEGKFHQVRKMTEAVHHRCKRLIRISIEDLELGDLQPGCVREIEEATFFRQLKIDDWQ